MSEVPFEFDDLDLSMAITATEVGVEVLQTCMGYFGSMLLHSLEQLSRLTGEEVYVLKSRYERELGLENVVENSLLTMRAAREFMGSSNHQGPQNPTEA